MLKQVIISILSFVLITTLFVTTYVSFVIFLCCSVQMVFSYFISFITSALTRDWYDFINNIIWMFYSIPYVHLLLGINLKIIKSYFHNIWKVLSFSGIQNTIRNDFDKTKCSRTIIVLKYVTIVCVILLLGTLLLIEIFTRSEEAVYSIYIGILSVIVPVTGFLKVLYQSMRSMFASAETLTISLHNIEQEMNKHETLKNSLENIDNSETTSQNNNSKVEQSLIDPCGIINQYDYLSYIKDAEVNHFASVARIRVFNKEMIPGLIIAVLVLCSIILDTIAFVQQQKYLFTTSIVGYAIRMLFYLFSLPFLIIFNFCGLFIDSNQTKERHKFIRRMWIFVLLFYSAFLIVSITFLLIINFRFDPYQLEHLEYNYMNYSNITISNLYKEFSSPSAICAIKYKNLSLLQYAGIAALGQSKNLNISKEILKYIFDGNEVPVELFSSNHDMFVYRVNISENFSVISFHSLITKEGISFLLENFFNDFIPSKIFRTIIPFYEVTYNLVLSRFMNILTEHLTFFVGVTQISPRYVKFNLNIHNNLALNSSDVVYTGHSIGGILAKSMGTSFSSPSISFESLSYYRSLFQATMQLYTSGEDMFGSNGFEMINSYSPSQIFSSSERNATLNALLPKWKTYYDLVNPYDTFCTIAAGCATDERYDGLCNATVGFDKYLHLFTLWNRTRSNYE
ncbi:hypothetical protein TRFO_26461 [Tritrichomonas foetus]|uniref:Fungal lipase-like domain-containing protein n=1 Tax=Tritrichomonas foetus TaxID=1144522 RepID=A0A1J4K7W2_9EUKA|nr:hypothetical protein TRFO_26461 [Tritrichomonas foetus]|eukprot:OHT05774.1 hypothetical protein TRFO_26461 [Tritrichomonas foetus]